MQIITPIPGRVLTTIPVQGDVLVVDGNGRKVRSVTRTTSPAGNPMIEVDTSDGFVGKRIDWYRI